MIIFCKYLNYDQIFNSNLYYIICQKFKINSYINIQYSMNISYIRIRLILNIFFLLVWWIIYHLLFLWKLHSLYILCERLLLITLRRLISLRRRLSINMLWRIRILQYLPWDHSLTNFLYLKNKKKYITFISKPFTILK